VEMMRNTPLISEDLQRRSHRDQGNHEEKP